jgi:HEAT repeat protein
MMKTLRVLTLTACAACLQAQTPVEKAWTILSDGAQDKSQETRGKAIQALGVISGNSRAESAADAALKDESEEVRVAAANALGEMKAKGSIPNLRAACKDPAAAVVFAAANGLFAMGDPGAYQIYYAALTGQRKTGDSLVESQMKMLKDPKALGALGFEAGMGFIPFGGVAVSTFKMVKADTVSPVRAAAAMKLARDPDPKSGEALAAALRDEKWLVRAAVVDAIAKRDDPSLLPALVPLLGDENDVVRFNAAAAVIHLTQSPRGEARSR